MANSPPAIAGVLKACVTSRRSLTASSAVRVYHRKCRSQLNAPQCSSKLRTYANVSSLIMSITGHTTRVLSSATRPTSPSSHPEKTRNEPHVFKAITGNSIEARHRRRRRRRPLPKVHSQCASRKTRIFPFACRAPTSRAFIRPIRFGERITRVDTDSPATYSSRSSSKNSKNESWTNAKSKTMLEVRVRFAKLEYDFEIRISSSLNRRKSRLVIRFKQ